MKFAGKRRKSTEGVTLSGAGHTGATVNGSTLWRHPDEPGAEGATYAARMNLSGKRTEKILQHSISIVVSSIPCMFHIWDLLFSMGISQMLSRKQKQMEE